MKCLKTYKNEEKKRAMIARSKRRYASRSIGLDVHAKEPWSEDDDKEILDHLILDIELAKKLGRTRRAIQIRRSRLKARMANETSR